MQLMLICDIKQIYREREGERERERERGGGELESFLWKLEALKYKAIQDKKTK